MRYLFFDIECCDGAHICEFGYVLCDENFKTIKKRTILMNPEKPFNLGGRRFNSGIALSYPERVYRKNPTFSAYYEEIKALLCANDQMVIGFSTSNDANFLNIACEEYEKEAIIFKFYDVQRAYKNFFGETASLENAAKSLDVALEGRLHESSDDALLTMQLAKAMCLRKNASLGELLASAASANFGGDLNKQLACLVEHPAYFSAAELKRMVREFAERALPEGDVTKNALFNKRVCFSERFETDETKNCIVLMQQIINRGGHVVSKASECKFFVKHASDDVKIKKSRYYYAKTAARRTVKILTLDELLSLLNLTSEQLAALPVPQLSLDFPSSYVSVPHATFHLGDII